MKKRNIIVIILSIVLCVASFVVGFVLCIVPEHYAFYVENLYAVCDEKDIWFKSYSMERNPEGEVLINGNVYKVRISSTTTCGHPGSQYRFDFVEEDENGYKVLGEYLVGNLAFYKKVCQVTVEENNGYVRKNEVLIFRYVDEDEYKAWLEEKGFCEN